MAFVTAALAVGSALAGAVSSLIAAKKSAQAQRNADNLINQQQRENQSWYNTKMSQDYTQRADALAAINKQRELLQEQYKVARATNDVAGGSDAQLAAQKELANQSVAQTMSDIAVNGAQAKDAAEQQYLQTKSALTQQQVGNLQNKAGNISAAGGQALSAGVNLTGSILDTQINKQKS